MTREEAEALRKDKRHWKLGVIYACRADPRIIVHNRFVMGWTWNFGHPWALPTLFAFVVVALGPAGLLLLSGVTNAPVLMSVVATSVLVLVGFAHYSASGPR